MNLEVRRHTPQTPWTYAQLDRRQREIAERVRQGGEGALLLSEVAPVITMGRRTETSAFIQSPEQLDARGIKRLPVDRGGLATYHGPGQWVLFAVDRLDRLTGDPRGVRRAVTSLLAIAEEAGRQFTPEHEAEIREGAELGVWSRAGKFAAVGVHVSQGVLLHGLSVNGFATPESFLGIRPCGLDAPVSFLLNGPDGFMDLGRFLVGAASRHLWCSAMPNLARGDSTLF